MRKLLPLLLLPALSGVSLGLGVSLLLSWGLGYDWVIDFNARGEGWLEAVLFLGLGLAGLVKTFMDWRSERHH